MLRVSKLADYGTAVMVHLAHQQDRLLTAKAISEQLHLGVPTVSKLLKLLAGARLLSSQRGANGGYSLTRRADDISVAQIIQAIDGSMGLTECVHDESECVLEPVCRVSANWQLINKAIYSALESITLAALATPQMPMSKIDVSQIMKMADRKPERQLES